MMRAALSVGLAAALVLAASAATASAAPTTEVVQGDVIRIESTLDRAAMASMVTGDSVAWELAISADRPDGTIDVSLEAQSTDGDFDVVVERCDEAWVDGACMSGSTVAFAGALASTVTAPLAQQSSDDARWYRVEVSLVGSNPGARADIVVRARGMGDDVASNGDATLPRTGLEEPLALLLLAAAALIVALPLLVRERRRR